MLGYQGLSSRSSSQRQQVSYLFSSQTGLPSDAAKCAVEVSTAITKSKFITSAAVSEKSLSSCTWSCTSLYIPIDQKILTNMGLCSSGISQAHLEIKAAAARGSLRTFTNNLVIDAIKLGEKLPVDTVVQHDTCNAFRTCLVRVF